jgi:hypothetical protein
MEEEKEDVANHDSTTCDGEEEWECVDRSEMLDLEFDEDEKEEESKNEESKKNRKKKKIACWAYGIGSATIAIGGGALMILGGPIGMMAGGIIMGAGISGEFGTIQ